MDLSFWLNKSFLTKIHSLVSILVMMDLSFWQNWETNIPTLIIVSILVMMDLSFWPSSIMLLVIWYSVSILVMMDLSFWHVSIEHVGGGIRLSDLVLSFNPCYDGFVILTTLNAKSELTRHLFQSLLWWICHFDFDRLFVSLWLC